MVFDNDDDDNDTCMTSFARSTRAGKQVNADLEKRLRAGPNRVPWEGVPYRNQEGFQHGGGGGPTHDDDT